MAPVSPQSSALLERILRISEIVGDMNRLRLSVQFVPLECLDPEQLGAV